MIGGEREREERSINIIVRGISEEPGEGYEVTREKLERVFADKLKVRVSIMRAKRIGKFSEGRNRMIFASFLDLQEKWKVTAKKTGDLKRTRIFIDDDYSPKNS